MSQILNIMKRKFQQSHDQQFHQDQQDNSLQIIEHKKYSRHMPI